MWLRGGREVVEDELNGGAERAEAAQDADDLAPVDGADEADVQSLPRRTRLALEALGPTFVKLGQILATRGDLLSPEWIAELEQLHSRAPTLPFEQRIVE